MAAAIQERGLAASTVADVVRHARASRRTFYEHFRDRDDCYLAPYGCRSTGSCASSRTASCRGRTGSPRSPGHRRPT
ncbi:MAG: helix-turn-helix domain-containing protein [Solirubrobacteraceae bacterium]